jgi:hypothetical protein
MRPSIARLFVASSLLMDEIFGEFVGGRAAWGSRSRGGARFSLAGRTSFRWTQYYLVEAARKRNEAK